MATTHTPGPWQVEHGRSSNPMVGTADVTVAEILDDVFPDTDQQAANARLIAAAPAMLAVLTEAVASTGSAHPRECGMYQYVPVGRAGIVKQGPCDCWVGRAVAVIAAATTPGEAP